MSTWISRLALGSLLLQLVGCGDPQLYLRPAYVSTDRDVVDFGEVEVGLSEQRIFTLLNKGDRSLKLLQYSGDLLGAFSLDLEEGSVDGQSDLKVRVFFSPVHAGAFETTVVLENDSVNQPELPIVLKGTGVARNPCRDVVCNSPPAPACIGDGKSRVFDPAGTCVAGECEYRPVEEDCDEEGCDQASGRCASSLCRGVVCDAPPGSCFLPKGTCSAGVCVYTPADGVFCNDGDPCTTEDSCSQGMCGGTRKTCIAPPDPYCTGVNDLIRYEPVGACNAQGDCVYARQDVFCAHGCDNGVCKGDPCPGGCNAGPACTVGRCDPARGCVYEVSAATDGQLCTTGHADCPNGRCGGGSCQVITGAAQTCQAEIKYDLCQKVKVPGVCTASGGCAADRTAPENQCGGCDGLCIKCTITTGFTVEKCIR